MKILRFSVQYIIFHVTVSEFIISRKAVGGVRKPCRDRHLNFILEIAHYGANVNCVRVPKSEGERSLFPFQCVTSYNSVAYLL